MSWLHKGGPEIPSACFERDVFAQNDFLGMVVKELEPAMVKAQEPQPASEKQLKASLSLRLERRILKKLEEFIREVQAEPGCPKMRVALLGGVQVCAAIMAVAASAAHDRGRLTSRTATRTIQSTGSYRARFASSSLLRRHKTILPSCVMSSTRTVSPLPELWRVINVPVAAIAKKADITSVISAFAKCGKERCEEEARAAQ